MVEPCSSEQCAGLGRIDYGEVDGYQVCIHCGTEVTGSADYVADAGGDYASGGGYNGSVLGVRVPHRHRDRDQAKQQALANFVSRLASAVNAPRAQQERICHLVEKVRPQLGAGRKMNSLCAACAYIVMRQNHLVMTMVEVADASNVSVFEVGRAFKEVMAFMAETSQAISWGDIHTQDDPEFFLTKCLDFLSDRDLLCGKEQEVHEYSKRLQQLAQLNQLFDGVKDNAVVCACVILSCKGCDCDVDMEKVVEPLGASISTTKKQMTAIKTMLVQVSKEFIPYMIDISIRNLDKYLKDVLKHLKMLHKASRASRLNSTTVGKLMKSETSVDALVLASGSSEARYATDPLKCHGP